MGMRVGCWDALYALHRAGTAAQCCARVQSFGTIEVIDLLHLQEVCAALVHDCVRWGSSIPGKFCNTVLSGAGRKLFGALPRDLRNP